MATVKNAINKIKRNEFKHFISYADAIRLERQIACVLTPDKFSQTGPYRVKSLYFDSLNNIDFATKINGENIKKKIRLRIYSENTDRVKLELKEKEGIFQEKTTVVISREDAVKLCEGSYGVLLNYKGEDALRIYTKMVFGHYSPVVVVEYNRRAYIHSEYNTRITFDSEVKSSEINLDLFDPVLPMAPVITEGVILEVKYNGKLLKYVSDVFKPYSLTNVSASKYCSSRRIFQEYII